MPARPVPTAPSLHPLPDTMRAAVVTRYGPPKVARIAHHPTPQPRTDTCVVRVATTVVTSGDARVRGARFPAGFAALSRLALGVRRPRARVLGSVFAGTVAAGAGLAADGTPLSPGDRVCGMNGARFGAHAEYLGVPTRRCVRIPDGVTFDQAAAVLFGGTTAWHFLHRVGRLSSDLRVLVNGASGAGGLTAVQLAVHAGATVTAVTSAANADLLRRLGALRIVDHRTESVAALAERPERFDLVLDTVGNVPPAVGRRLLSADGLLLLLVASLGQNLAARGQVRAGVSQEDPETMARLLALIAEGALNPVVDGVFSLEQIAEAHTRADSGRKVGELLIHP